ncbi:hypothetical protein [Winogradskyella endarachnes]|uniref:Uncharacterized protein n=1 Tax=Winogradskyella endarachnes TaxID=2681965 RepID=A0A6L6UDQ8_9FLAO|nr:hypothetical protein [Winogradskyella endarachnes]MUU79666.1 hypothetical protein [Winogradskyella endarachnes]
MTYLKNIIVYSLALVLLLSCSFNEGNFTVINKSDFKIDSLSIQPDSKHQMFSLDKNESITVNTNMNSVDIDGSYIISFKRDNKTMTEKQFGYYTNGYQIEDIINITVLNDTILINSKFDKTY